MSDVKKFTGFIAVDGSTHTSMKSATDHSREVKVQAALKEKFGDLLVTEGEQDLENTGGVALDTFIYANREAILAALNQQVTTRKPRTPKAKVKPANTAAANDSQPAAA
jgi:hypothetical protein